MSSSRQSSLPLPLSNRLLFPSLQPPSPLPPLLLSNSIPPDELYHLIALALRAFVNPWWTKITRYDKEFLPEINRIITVVVRALEARLINTDLTPLIFHHIPLLITQHYLDIRNAKSKLTTSYATGASLSLPVLFHQLQPHMAITPDGEQIDQVYIRQVVDHVLMCCLPPEDYRPEAERFIVREVVVKVLVQDVIPSITEPWFLHKVVLDLVGPVEDKRPTKPVDAFSFHALLVFFLSAVQSISGICLALIHAYKQAVSTIKAVNHPPTTKPISSPRQPSPYTSPSSSTSSLSFPAPATPPHASDTHDYAHASLMMISEVFTMHDRFASNTVMSGVNLLSALFTPFLDRLLPHILYTHLLSPTRLLHLLRLTTTSLFPNGYPSPPPQIPTEAEQAQLRQALIHRLADIISRSSLSSSRSRTGMRGLLGRVLLGPTERGREEVIEGVLDGLGDRRCNTHLVLFILDAIVVRVFPELAVDQNQGQAGEGLTAEGMSRSVSGATYTTTTPG